MRRSRHTQRQIVFRVGAVLFVLSCICSWQYYRSHWEGISFGFLSAGDWRFDAITMHDKNGCHDLHIRMGLLEIRLLDKGHPISADYDRLKS